MTDKQKVGGSYQATGTVIAAFLTRDARRSEE